MTGKQSGTFDQGSASANGETGGEEAKRGFGRRMLLRAGVLAGGASMSLAAATRSAAAMPQEASSKARSEASEVSSRSLTVAEYAVARLAALGIEHAFGVVGDYAFAFDNAIKASDRVCSAAACSCRRRRCPAGCKPS